MCVKYRSRIIRDQNSVKKRKKRGLKKEVPTKASPPPQKPERKNPQNLPHEEKKRKNRHLCFCPRVTGSDKTPPNAFAKFFIRRHTTTTIGESPPKKKRKRRKLCYDGDGSWRVGWGVGLLCGYRRALSAEFMTSKNVRCGGFCDRSFALPRRKESWASGNHSIL